MVMLDASSAETEERLVVYQNTQNVNNSTHLSSIRIPRKGDIIQMEDIKNLSVYESNELIYSAPKVTPNVIKIFDLAVSGIHKNDEIKKTVLLSDKAVLYCLGIEKDKNRYGNLSKILKESIRTLMFDLSVNDENGEIIVAFESIKWSKSSGHIEFVFTESIMKYLSNFDGGKFTRYALEDISKLENKYSVFLYKVFIMYFNQYKKYENEKILHPSFSIEELRTLLNIKDNEYLRINNFTKRVINDPLEDINKNTALKVSASKEKVGVILQDSSFQLKRILKILKRNKL